MSAILSIDGMINLENQAFLVGVDAWELMFDAGKQTAEAVKQFCPVPGRCIAYVGKGNNGGDALVAAKYLQADGWETEVRLVFPPSEMSLLARRALRAMPVVSDPLATEGQGRLIILDGLLGLGAKGPLRSPIKEAAAQINFLRWKRGAVVFALDIPTGLENDPELSVIADHTLAAGHPKELLVRDESTARVGRISVLPLEDLPLVKETHDQVATPGDLRLLLPRRTFDIHKGQCGRVALVAGSPGMTGAAILAAQGALRSGAGLVTVFCAPTVINQISTRMPPEVMVRAWGRLSEIAGENFDVLGIGPGLAVNLVEEIAELVARSKVPMVLDAGALAIFNQESAFNVAGDNEMLLTPHPGEMERMFPRGDRSRADWARAFVEASGMTLLLKGARTVVAEAGQPLSFNPTGHPGMATGGMGDTLTGVCAALLGQGLSTYDAARLGAWVCGRAAEVAVWENDFSQESLLPSDVAARLGRAFADCRQGVF